MSTNPGGGARIPASAAPATTANGPFSDALVEDLRLIAEGVVSVAAGFSVAGIRVRRGDELELVVDTGSPHQVGSRVPVDAMLKELEHAEDWGTFRFVPHEGVTAAGTEGYAWVVPTRPALDVAAAWHPMDMLVAPVFDDHGELRGALSLDEPADGLRPNSAQRQVIEGFAAPAGRAVLSAVENEALAEQVAMAETIKEIVRTTSAQLHFKGLLAACEQSLMQGFRADAMWIQTIIEEDSTEWAYTAGDVTTDFPPAIVEFAAAAASYCWYHQIVVTVGEGYPMPPMMTAQQHREIRQILDRLEMSSLIFVPLGAGHEHMGGLVLARGRNHDQWTPVECTALLDIGHDLGRATLNARIFERERALVDELRAVDTYKNQLIATVSHELKNPLTAVTGHLELLEADLTGISDQAQKSLAAIARASQRMSSVIEDLLLLRRTADPLVPLNQDGVDLGALVHDAIATTELVARSKSVTVEVRTPDAPALAVGEREALDKMVINLISNAIKYTPEGRGVNITVESHPDRVVLRVADQGIGISQTDLPHLFTEFFRSTNPVAIAEPGTGLGLSIVQRTVERHRGTIEVESIWGEGSVFIVTLPTRPDATATSLLG